MPQMKLRPPDGAQPAGACASIAVVMTTALVSSHEDTKITKVHEAILYKKLFVNPRDFRGFVAMNWCFIGHSLPQSATSMRIVPSCRDVMKISPSLLRLICRSARVTDAPFAFSTRSRSVTYTRLPDGPFTYSWISSTGATVS